MEIRRNEAYIHMSMKMINKMSNSEVILLLVLVFVVMGLELGEYIAA